MHIYTPWPKHLWFQLTELTKRKKLKKKSENYGHTPWPKTVGGVALTRHPLTMRVLGKKQLS